MDLFGESFARSDASGSGRGNRLSDPAAGPFGDDRTNGTESSEDHTVRLSIARQPYTDEPELRQNTDDLRLFTIGDLEDGDESNEDIEKNRLCGDGVFATQPLQATNAATTASSQDEAADSTTVYSHRSMSPLQPHRKPSIVARVSSLLPFGTSKHQSLPQHQQISNTSHIALPTHYHRSHEPTANARDLSSVSIDSDDANATNNNNNNNNNSSNNNNNNAAGGLFRSYLPTAAKPRPPSNYICPLTLQVYDEPMHDGCGHTFERSAILDWLEIHEICPVSRKPCSVDNLRPATLLQQRIQRWKYARTRAYLQNIAGSATNNEQLTPFDEQIDIELQARSDHPHDQGRETDATTTTVHSDRYQPGIDTYSTVELMLLPQERKVLHIVRVRAHARRKRMRIQRIQNTAIAIGAVAIICIIVYIVM